MGRDRRRGKRRYQVGARPGPGRQPGSQSGVPGAQPPDAASASQKASGAAAAAGPVAGAPVQKGPGQARVLPRAGGPVKTPVLANPHLGKDLRNIAIVTATLLLLLIVLWLALS